MTHTLVTGQALDASASFCSQALASILGPHQAAVAFRQLPALLGLVAFKSEDEEPLRLWALEWLSIHGEPVLA